MNINRERIPTINARRISLRQYAASDLDAIYEIHADPEVMRYLGGSPMLDRSEAQKFMAKALEDFSRGQSIEWGIARRSDNRLMGSITFFSLDAFARRAEIGFALGRPHWGRGYMHEALQAALGYGFNELEFRRVEADTDPNNFPAVRLLERVGFKREGFLRERWVVPNETQDALFYGLLKREWDSAGTVYEVVQLPQPPASVMGSLRSRVARSRVRRWAAVPLRWLH
ncbi:MAG TPA: GNAT family N-acetyltransferase [Candidatus Binatia bacterium]|nr:GNAT family N-acetyltransferase [Candidatus Binatia bacterium]